MRMNPQEDDAEDDCCMCELCWKYGWHHTAPWYAKLMFSIRKWYYDALSSR